MVKHSLTSREWINHSSPFLLGNFVFVEKTQSLYSQSKEVHCNPRWWRKYILQIIQLESDSFKTQQFSLLLMMVDHSIMLSMMIPHSFISSSNSLINILTAGNLLISGENTVFQIIHWKCIKCIYGGGSALFWIWID